MPDPIQQSPSAPSPLLLSLALLVALAVSALTLLPALGQGSQPPSPEAVAPETPSEPSAAETPATEAPRPAQAPDAGRVRGPGPETVHETLLAATWDPERRSIRGRERLTWRNTASVPVTQLCFHHYLNAFSSNRTTFMVESGGRLRGDDFDGENWGWIEVDSLTLPDGTDLAPFERYEAPDDGNPHDRTVAVYPLPEAIPPGGEITVDIAFESRMPSIFARTGAEGDYILAGQWFPKIAVFEDAGDRGRAEPGWNCHQFHANSEFYADFGNYDVTLTLPRRYQGKVGATGALVSEGATDDGAWQVRFYQEGVHDFAWTADPEFLVVEERFDPARDVPQAQRRRIAQLLGMDEGSPQLDLPPVDLTLLLQPSHRHQADRYLEATRAAIRGYGLRLGPYPYPTLTLVDPPRGADGSGGMEYPTFITLGTTALFEMPPFDRILLPEIVTIHEFGHQYFQGMIASNEFEESWLDEGINSYVEMLVMEETYPAALSFLGLEASSFELARLRMGDRFRDPIVLPSWRYFSGASYGINSYPRTAVTLRHLENLLGTETFHRALRRFFQEHQWGHPATADFERTIEAATGRDLQWFFRQALHSARSLDYAVHSVSSRRLSDEEGVFWRDGERIQTGDGEGEPDDLDLPGGPLGDFLRGVRDGWREARQDDGSEGGGGGGEDESAPGETAGDPGDGENGENGEEDRWISTVTVVRNGELVHPVTVTMRFEDGGVLERSWDGDTRWVRWTFETDLRLVWARVGPEGGLALDVNRLNDSRLRRERPLPRRKLLADLLFLLQSFLSSGGIFA